MKEIGETVAQTDENTETVYQENVLTPMIYHDLRNSVGWSNFSREHDEEIIRNSLYTVTAFCKDRAIAMGRLAGDGMYDMIVDVAVCPDYQGRGIGTAIIQKMIKYVKNSRQESTSVQLVAEKGKEKFYVKQGFSTLPDEQSGAGMQMIFRK